jgi:hypothetical protein
MQAGQINSSPGQHGGWHTSLIRTYMHVATLLTSLQPDLQLLSACSQLTCSDSLWSLSTLPGQTVYWLPSKIDCGAVSDTTAVSFHVKVITVFASSVYELQHQAMITKMSVEGPSVTRVRNQA